MKHIILAGLALAFVGATQVASADTTLWALNRVTNSTNRLINCGGTASLYRNQDTGAMTIKVDLPSWSTCNEIKTFKGTYAIQRGSSLDLPVDESRPGLHPLQVYSTTSDVVDVMVIDVATTIQPTYTPPTPAAKMCWNKKADSGTGRWQFEGDFYSFASQEAKANTECSIATITSRSNGSRLYDANGSLKAKDLYTYQIDNSLSTFGARRSSCTEYTCTPTK